jgi:hypothetical protein
MKKAEGWAFMKDSDESGGEEEARMVPARVDKPPARVLERPL